MVRKLYKHFLFNKHMILKILKAIFQTLISITIIIWVVYFFILGIQKLGGLI